MRISSCRTALHAAETGERQVDTCRHCRWWRIPIEEDQKQDIGLCMYEPPIVFCDYDAESGEAAIFYERPKTYDYDYCSHFEKSHEK